MIYARSTGVTVKIERGQAAVIERKFTEQESAVIAQVDAQCDAIMRRIIGPSNVLATV